MIRNANNFFTVEKATVNYVFSYTGYSYSTGILVLNLPVVLLKEYITKTRHSPHFNENRIAVFGYRY